MRKNGASSRAYAHAPSMEARIEENVVDQEGEEVSHHTVLSTDTNLLDAARRRRIQRPRARSQQ